MAATMAPKLLTPDEAAAELGVSVWAVRKAMQRGSLRVTEAYGRKLISAKALEEYKARPTREYRDPRRGRNRQEDHP